MKLDIDLIKKILVYVEENHEEANIKIEKLEDYDNILLMYHCELLVDRGFLKGEIMRVNTGEGFYIGMGLTWEGHEFLSSIKNDTVFKKVKKTLKEQGLDFTLEVVAILAAKYTKEMIK